MNYNESIFEGTIVAVLIIVFVTFVLGLYFLPALLAMALHNPKAFPIFLLNLFTGWSGLGWIGSLIWAVV